MEHFGIDLHQKHSDVCGLAESGEIVFQQRIPTTETRLRGVFGKRAKCRIVLESSCLVPWVRRLLKEMGHDVLVVNPRKIRLIAESTLKCDRLDAEILARLSRMGEGFLRPVYQRSEAAQELRSRLRVRSSLVKARTALINSVRGTLRSQGYRMGPCSTASFAQRFFKLKLPKSVTQLVEPLLETIIELSDRIAKLDKELAAEADGDELMVRLQEVPGVGPLVCLAYIAWMDRAGRFRRSREVGACLGLRPQVRDSGEKTWRGPISREGDTEMRRLLVQAAHAFLLRRQDSALRRWAERLIQRVGKRKAIVALARKLGVLLHRLWVTGDSYRPFPKAMQPA